MGKYKLSKHPEFGHIYGPVYATPTVRCVWVYLTKPKTPPPPKEGQPASQPRYEITLLLPKEEGSTKQFLKAIKEVSVEMKDLFNKGRSAKIGDLEVAKDGDAFDTEKYPYYAGNWVITPRNAKPVGVFNVEKQEIETATIQGGMLVAASVTPLLTAHGISYKLNVIKLVEDDGVRLGGNSAQAAIDALFEEDKEEEDKEDEEQDVVEVKKTTRKSGKEAALDVL